MISLLTELLIDLGLALLHDGRHKNPDHLKSPSRTHFLYSLLSFPQRPLTSRQRQQTIPHHSPRLSSNSLWCRKRYLFFFSVHFLVQHTRLLKKFIKGLTFASNQILISFIGDTWREQYLWLSTQREKQKEAFVLMNQLLFKEAVALLNQYDLGNDLALMLKDALNGKQVSLRAAGEFLTSKYGNFIEISLIV